MSLPERWVDRIFERLTLVYGRDFMARYEGLGETAEEGAAMVRADWARELDGFEHHPHLLKFALEHLPDRAPTVVEFCRLAKSGPDIQTEQPRRLEAPASAATRQRFIEALQPALKRPPRDPRQWARDLLRDHEAGWRGTHAFRATPTSLAMARDALREPLSFEETQP
jgi:hypothetical protein